MNTIGNWSDPAIYRCGKTPYVGHAPWRRPASGGQRGLLGQVRRRLRPASFAEPSAPAMARQKGRTAGDPWCLGYFVDNELSWGDELSLAVGRAGLAGRPAGQAGLPRRPEGEIRARSSGSTQPGAPRHASWAPSACWTAAPPADAEEGPRRPGRLRHAVRRAVLPHLPRGGQGGRPAAACTSAAASPGPTIGRSARPRQYLRRGQLQPLPAERRRPAPAGRASIGR